MQTVCIPGLGFDHRIFQKLDLGTDQVNYLDWIEPEPGEHLDNYAERMANAIPQGTGPLILVGQSFGGMVSQLIATQRKVDLIILISSLRSRSEMHWGYKLVPKLQLHYLFSKQLILYSFPFWARAHDFKTLEDQRLFRSIVSGYSNTYYKWALRAFAKWQPPQLPGHTQVFQIHGNADKTLPFSLIQHPDVVIEGGSHFMVYTRASELSAVIQPLIDQVKTT